MHETVKYYLHGVFIMLLCFVFSLILNEYSAEIVSFHYPIGLGFAVFVAVFCFPYLVGFVNGLLCKYLWNKDLRLNVWFNGFFLFLLVTTYKLFFDLFLNSNVICYIIPLIGFPYLLAYLSNKYIVGED